MIPPCCIYVSGKHATHNLQASLVDNQSEQKQIAYAQELMSQGPDAGGTNGVSVVGLRNATGEYNCFLNVIIQCLWHCHHFRKQVMRWDPAAYQVSIGRLTSNKCMEVGL